MACRKFPEGKRMCTMLPSEIVGDAIQVMDFFQRFDEVLGVEGLFSSEQLEIELSTRCFDISCSGSALNIAHISLLKVLCGELQTKASAVVNPSSDRRASAVNCGNMLPVNELTWPEVARRYLLAVMPMDRKADSVGDGDKLCGSLTGVFGMEAGALLLAQAMKKIFGSLDRRCDMLIVDDGGADQPSASGSSTQIEGNDTLEWAQLLMPVRTLPANVGSRIKNRVCAALEKSPPEWAKKILENSISKEVYKKSNACGPTKKAVVSVLNVVFPEGEGKKAAKDKKKTDEARNYVSISDLIMKLCRIIWRQVANAAYCDTEDEGILGFSANVSRPLDFKTIDLKLAAGAYDGSHEAFLEDVCEFWNHVRISWRVKPDLSKVVDNLASKFDELYREEVLGQFHKLQGYARSGCLTGDSKNHVERLIASASVLQKAPWETGICKICSVDKEDNLVILCATCDAEYHTYCLNPPLARVPLGRWYCPLCVSKQNDEKCSSACVSASSGSSRPNRGEFTGLLFSEFSKLASLLEEKDYWEYSVHERTSLLKFLCDDVLNSALLRQHLVHCSETSDELQPKLFFAYKDFNEAKKKELKLAAKIGEIGEVWGIFEDNSLGNDTEYRDELKLVKKKLTHLRESISNMEIQLMKVSYQREFLGANSAGKLYWVWVKLGRKCVIENDGASTWVIYETRQELEELVDSLRESDVREIELKRSIRRRLKMRFHEPENETLNEAQDAPSLSYKDSPGSKSLSTKAAGLLEGMYGSCFDLERVLANKKRDVKVISDEKLIRCSCLELILPSIYHCLSCHKTFSTNKDGHNLNQCKSGIIVENKTDDMACKASSVLVQLKMNLLDMEAALPTAALRPSKACVKRRWAWRAFVKSAKSIDEMVQALMVFEDMIKSEYLKNTWWYWSSFSVAAKISTFSALALRVYALDAAIIYDKSASSFKVDNSDAAGRSGLARKAKKRRME